MNLDIIVVVCEWVTTGRLFSPGAPVSSTKKTDLHDIAQIVLKVALNTIDQTKSVIIVIQYC